MDDNKLMVQGEVSLTDPRVQAQARLLRAVLPGGAKMSDTDALALAAYAASTGLDPVAGECYFIPGVGAAPGYKGELKKRPSLREQQRMLTQDEKDFHDVEPGDKASICTLTDRGEFIAEGFGIVRRAEQWKSFEWATNKAGKNFKRALPPEDWKERADPPNGRSWGWVAQKRALKDALNHAGISTGDDSGYLIIERARAEGLRLPEIPEDAVLSIEQASRVVEQARASESVSQSDIEAGVAALAKMRAEQDLGYGEDTPAQKRPFPADTRAGMLRKDSAYGGGDPDEFLRRKAMANLANLTDGNNSAQKKICEYVWGCTSRAQLDAGMCNAIIHWANARNVDDQWMADPLSVQEAQLILHAYAETVGQMKFEDVQGDDGLRADVDPLTVDEQWEKLGQDVGAAVWARAEAAINLRGQLSKAALDDTAAATAKAVTACKQSMAALVGPDEVEALALVIFGKPVEMWTRGQCLAVYKWIDADDDWVPSDEAIDGLKVLLPRDMEE